MELHRAGLLIGRYIRGLELSKISALAQAAISSSSVTSLVPKTAYNAFFAAFIIYSKTPPKCGALGGLKTHLMPLCAVVRRFFLYRAVSLVLRVHLTAPTKFVPLSLVIADGVRLLLVNLDNA